MAMAKRAVELLAGAITDRTSTRGLPSHGYNYDHLKDAMLQKFNISAETYCQRIRAATVSEGASTTDTYCCLQNLYHRWVHPNLHSKEEIRKLVVLEQLLRVLPYDSST